MLKPQSPNVSKVIESIRDESFPFDMRLWGTCICGHIRKVMIVEGKYAPSGPEIKKYVGLSDDDAYRLFSASELTDDQCTDRELAVERLLKLVNS